MLLDPSIASPTPYHYATPKVGYLPPVMCPPSPVPSQTPPPGHFPPWLRPTLLILHIRIWQRAIEMEITVRHGYAASIGSLVCALTKRESDRERAFD